MTGGKTNQGLEMLRLLRIVRRAAAALVLARYEPAHRRLRAARYHAGWLTEHVVLAPGDNRR